MSAREQFTMDPRGMKLTDNQIFVLEHMFLDWGTPAAQVAADVSVSGHEMSAATALIAMRELRKMGFADFGPWFDDDSGAISGRGYSLNRRGDALRASLS